MPRLYHVSEREEITRFDPQPAPDNPDAQGDVVWAIDEEHLPNYLLPRDAPRVCFVESGRRIVAVEREWVERIQSAKLYIYEFSDAAFELFDRIAGYWISAQPMTPITVRAVTDLFQELGERNAELRIVDDLWILHDHVKLSTTEFSMIRMRNANSRAV